MSVKRTEQSKVGRDTPCAPPRVSSAGRGLPALPAASLSRRHRAFTLVELLVVIAIIGIVAAASVPALKNFQRVDADAAATRQLADEIANARQRAISQRSDVYMVFIPPAQTPGLPYAPAFNEANYFTSLLPAPQQVLQQATNLLGYQYTGYGFYSERTVGDQPGQSNPRYLGEWRQLPEGTFIAPSKFFANMPAQSLPSGICPGVNHFWYWNFPFPTADSPRRPLPYIAFDFEGRVFHLDGGGNKVFGADEVIPLARGSVNNPSGRSAPFTAEADEKPPGNSITNYTHVRVNWLTGRASIERQQVR